MKSTVLSSSHADPSRRQFLKHTGLLAAGTALAGAAIPHVHAAERNTIQLAIVGCGPRGSGAVGNAMSAPGGPVKLIAMADLFPDKLERAHKALTKEFGDRIDVPADRQFLGFDAYRKAIDCLRPGDVALLTTRAAFRATHLEYAVSKGVHVFMEKSFAVDPVGVRRIIAAGEAAKKKNLKIAAGLQCRHSTARQELVRKIRHGSMGDIQLIRAYRMQSGGSTPPRKPAPGDNELLYQIRNSVPFLWSSTGKWMDNMIHQVDECCWLKNGWPVSAHGVGGRIPHSTDCSQNLDSYSIEYTFADGAKAMVVGRFIPKCYNEFATFVHGTLCAAQFSGNIHAPTVQTYRDQRIQPDNITWQPAKETANPWQAEWNVLLDAIRKDRPHNEAERAAQANLVALMGRAAVHSGRIVTWEEAVASKFCWCPNIDTLTADSPAPVTPDAEGRYPAPIPGAWSEI
jgi:predicted dehydrogenase